MISDTAWEFYKRTGTVAGLCTAAMGVGIFFFQQNQRIGTLEAQMQALATRAVTWDGSIDPPANPSPSASRPPQSATPSGTTSINPIAELCAEMARKLVQESDGKPISALNPISTTMDRLNCKAFAR